MGKYSTAQAAIVKDRREQEKRLKACLPMLDLAQAACRFWEKLTGNTDADYGYNYGTVSMNLNMGYMMTNGRYPTRKDHLAYLLEFIEDGLDGLVKFEHYSQEIDSYSEAHNWGTWGKKFRLSSINGGNCTYKKVGTKIIEQNIYEQECK